MKICRFSSSSQHFHAKWKTFFALYLIIEEKNDFSTCKMLNAKRSFFIERWNDEKTFFSDMNFSSEKRDSFWFSSSFQIDNFPFEYADNFLFTFNLKKFFFRLMFVVNSAKNNVDENQKARNFPGKETTNVHWEGLNLFSFHHFMQMPSS